LIGGVLAILYGLITLIIRFTNHKYKVFSKLPVMEEKYSKIKGNIIHIFGYTIAPMILGIILLLNQLV
jgi:hypothetical protein